MADRFVVVSPDTDELPTGVADQVLKRAGDNSGWVLQDKFQLVKAALAAANSPIDTNGQPITSPDPAAQNQLATKNYVDAIAQGLSTKPSSTAATTAPLPAYTVSGGGATLTANANGALPAQDGVTLQVGQNLLVRNEAVQVNNGLFQLVQAGDGTHSWILQRASALAVGMHASGAYSFIEQGTVNLGAGFVCTSAPGSDVVGTNNLVWTQFSGAGEINAGNGIQKSGNTLSVGAGHGIQSNSNGTVDVVYGAGSDMAAADGAAAAAGVLDKAARADHKHQVATAAPSGLAFGTGNIAGTSNNLARADHQHDLGTPGTPSGVGTAGSAGVAAAPARADHVHAHGAQSDGTLHAPVSSGANGFMSSSDKAKLDGIGSTFSGTIQTSDGAPHAAAIDTLSVANTGRTYLIDISATSSDGAKGLGGSLTAVVRRTSSGVNVVVGPIVQNLSFDDANWSVTVTLAGNSVLIQVQDLSSGETVNWRWRGRIVESP